MSVIPFKSPEPQSILSDQAGVSRALEDLIRDCLVFPNDTQAEVDDTQAEVDDAQAEVEFFKSSLDRLKKGVETSRLLSIEKHGALLWDVGCYLAHLTTFQNHNLTSLAQSLLHAPAILKILAKQFDYTHSFSIIRRKTIDEKIYEICMPLKDFNHAFGFPASDWTKGEPSEVLPAYLAKIADASRTEGVPFVNIHKLYNCFHRAVYYIKNESPDALTRLFTDLTLEVVNPWRVQEIKGEHPALNRFFKERQSLLASKNQNIYESLLNITDLSKTKDQFDEQLTIFFFQSICERAFFQSISETIENLINTLHKKKPLGSPCQHDNHKGPFPRYIDYGEVLLSQPLELNPKQTENRAALKSWLEHLGNKGCQRLTKAVLLLSLGSTEEEIKLALDKIPGCYYKNEDITALKNLTKIKEPYSLYISGMGSMGRVQDDETELELFRVDILKHAAAHTLNDRRDQGRCNVYHLSHLFGPLEMLAVNEERKDYIRKMKAHHAMRRRELLRAQQSEFSLIEKQAHNFFMILVRRLAALKPEEFERLMAGHGSNSARLTMDSLTQYFPQMVPKIQVEKNQDRFLVGLLKNWDQEIKRLQNKLDQHYHLG